VPGSGHEPRRTSSTGTPATRAARIASAAFGGRPPLPQTPSTSVRFTLSAAASFGAPPRRVRRNRSATRTFAHSSGVRSYARRVSFDGRGFLHDCLSARMGGMLRRACRASIKLWCHKARHFQIQPLPSCWVVSFTRVSDTGNEDGARGSTDVVDRRSIRPSCSHGRRRAASHRSADQRFATAARAASFASAAVG
jgi:hypothetical protein